MLQLRPGCSQASNFLKKKRLFLRHGFPSLPNSFPFSLNSKYSQTSQSRSPFKCSLTKPSRGILLDLWKLSSPTWVNVSDRGKEIKHLPPQPHMAPNIMIEQVKGLSNLWPFALVSDEPGVMDRTWLPKSCMLKPYLPCGCIWRWCL